MNRHFLFTTKIIVGPLILLLMSSSLCVAETLIWAPQGLSALIDEGLANNQSIKSMEKQIGALKEQMSVAGSLPDPKIGFSLLNLPVDSFAFDKQPMTQKQIAIDQQIPWLSKLDLKSKTVALKVSQKTAMLKAARLTLASEIAQAYYELGYTAKSQEINDRLIKLVTGIRQNVENRYAVGEGLQQDIFQVDVELTNLADEKIMLRNKRRTIEDRINSLLNRAAYTTVALPSSLPITQVDITTSELNKILLSHNPDLAAGLAKIAEAETRIELAKKEYYPDFDLKVAYGQRDRLDTGQNEPDFFSAGVMVTVPLWHRKKQDRNLSSARLAHQAAQNAYNNLAVTLPNQADTLSTEMTDAVTRYNLYQGKLIPQAKEWDRSATQGYQVNKINFNTMIAARTRVLQFELKAEWYRFTFFSKRAELEALIGKPLTAAPLDENRKNEQQPVQPTQ